ncbi:MAG: PIN domain nuclease [Syntrophobacteraceae bacterium CG07_land_8_20_14_0_80_61_8]|nr:MAG: PIN domain nuclease [Syntrophobacteraceae bacterium CG07_land_8_20_14_0_80_61_8]
MAGGTLMLLDTCALLWLAQGGGQLSPEALQQLAEAPFVYVSAISGFEIGIKHAKGKLELPMLPLPWFNAIVAHHDLQVLSLDADICIRSTQLPSVHHDPCDRMIVATAQKHHLRIVTADPIFAAYNMETMG